MGGSQTQVHLGLVWSTMVGRYAFKKMCRAVRASRMPSAIVKNFCVCSCTQMLQIL